jgi:predicted MFS family arabinose efflux permease
MARDRGLTAALRHRDYRLMLSAFTLSDIGTWASTVAVAVWIVDVTGSVSWLAVATVCRFGPALVLSAWAGVLVERRDKARLLRTVDLLLLAVMAATAVAMTVEASVWVVLVLAAVGSTLGTTFEPAAASLTPQVVPERHLASANALRNTVDDLTVIAGPALGALLLLLGPPQNAVWANAASFAVSAALLSMVRTRSTTVDTSEGGELGALAQLTTGLRTILADPASAVLVGYSILATAIFGVDTILFVAVSDDLLGTGPDGYGYLLVGLGVGGLLAAPLVTRAEALPRLAPVIVGGMAAFCLPMLVVLVSGEPAVAFAAQVVRGAGTLVVDVLAVTALQRALPTDVLGRVFGAFDTLMIAAILVGSTLTSWSLAVLGTESTVWLSGAGTFALSLLGLPRLVRADRAAAARRAELAPYLEVLEAGDLFEQVGDGDLVELAGAATTEDVAAGQVVVRQGEEADAFYVVLSGRLAVVSRDDGGREVVVPDLHPGDHVGEIGLLQRSARTATVFAVEPTRLLRVPGEAFLDALTSYRPSAATLDGAALRLRRTHPAATLTPSTGAET